MRGGRRVIESEVLYQWIQLITKVSLFHCYTVFHGVSSNLQAAPNTDKNKLKTILRAHVDITKLNCSY